MGAGIFLLCAGLILPAAAQERPNGIRLLTPLGVSSGYDDNFVAGSRVLDDTVFLVTSPTVSWMASTHRTLFSVDYQAEFELFSRHENLDAWNHTATMRFRNQLTSRLSVDIGNSFLSTMDPTRRLIKSLLMLPRGRFDENAFYARLRYRLDHKTVLIGQFDNAVTHMDLPSDLAGRLNRLGFAGTLMLERKINPRHSFSASYAYLFVHPLASGPGSDNNSVHNVNFGYIYNVNPGLALRASAGVSRSLQTSFTGAAAVDKKFGELWLSAGYQRYVAFFGEFAPPGAAQPVAPRFANGLVPDSVYNVASLRAWGNLTRRIGLEGNVQRALNGVTADNRGIKSVIVQGRVDYRLTGRVTAFARAEFYGQNVSEFLPVSLSRRRYFGGLEFTLARPPELTTDPRKHPPLPGSDQDPIGEGHTPQERQ